LNWRGAALHAWLPVCHATLPTAAAIPLLPYWVLLPTPRYLPTHHATAPLRPSPLPSRRAIPPAMPLPTCLPPAWLGPTQAVTHCHITCHYTGLMPHHHALPLPHCSLPLPAFLTMHTFYRPLLHTACTATTWPATLPPVLSFGTLRCNFQEATAQTPDTVPTGVIKRKPDMNLPGTTTEHSSGLTVGGNYELVNEVGWLVG